MNVTVYLGWITLLLVGGVLAVSAYGVMADALTLKEFLAQWMPIATLILGYWFKGREDGQ